MNTENLSLEWTQTDSEGLVRVIPTESFREGIYIVTKIAELAEQTGYDPEIKLQTRKVTVWLIDESSSDVTDQEIDFAQQLDQILTN